MTHRRLVLVALAALALSNVPAPAGADSECERMLVDGIGPACLLENGLLEVFGPDGSSLGFTHGPDHLGDKAEDDAAVISSPIDNPTIAARNPSCVSGAAGEYYARVIYARASNDADNYASRSTTIRNQVRLANGYVYSSAQATGGAADLRVKCTGGVIDVANVVLPTPMASASFSTIVADLRALGYNDGRVKYWVYYDDSGACSCSGTGHIYNDDRLVAENYNNGNAGSMFAVSFAASTRTLLHELGHNMGAVQHGAPRSTGGFHCNDGFDIMCYADNGPKENYLPTQCPLQVWDCGNNDYFHRNPPAGTWLRTHWNLGNALNRFIVV